MAEIAGFREAFAAGLAATLAEVAPVLAGGCCWERVRAGWGVMGSS